MSACHVIHISTRRPISVRYFATYHAGTAVKNTVLFIHRPSTVITWRLEANSKIYTYSCCKKYDGSETFKKMFITFYVSFRKIPNLNLYYRWNIYTDFLSFRRTQFVCVENSIFSCCSCRVWLRLWTATTNCPIIYPQMKYECGEQRWITLTG
jgi:hypothetical protein